MHVSARADYAIRALTELASFEGRPTSRSELARAQEIPTKFLGAILAELTKAGLVHSHRGATGGYTLARPATETTVADVIRAVNGPLVGVRDCAPEDVRYEGTAKLLREVWVATRVAIRSVLEAVTLADLVSGRLVPEIRRLLTEEDAWHRR